MKKFSQAAQIQHKFDPAQILYLTGDVNYSTVCLVNDKSILTSRTLKWYNEQWPHFMRVHKSALVNPQHVYSCVVTSSIVAHIIMRNGARLPISRRRIGEVVEQLGLELPKYASTITHLVVKPEERLSISAHIKLA